VKKPYHILPQHPAKFRGCKDDRVDRQRCMLESTYKIMLYVTELTSDTVPATVQTKMYNTQNAATG
jgi:hypothetical protein